MADEYGNTPSASAVLRQPLVGQGRRLGMQQAEPVDTLQPPLPSPAAAKPDPAAVMASLRQTFSEQLAQLEEEARQRGLKKAAEESVATLRQLKEQISAKAAEEERKAKQTLDKEIKRLAELHQAIAEQQAGMYAAMEPTVIELVFAISSKLLGQRAIEQSVVAELSQQAIDQYRLATILKIHVSRADFDYLSSQDNASELLPYYQVDEHVALGSCVIDFGVGSLDASLDTQLAAIRDLLLQGRNRVAKP